MVGLSQGPANGAACAQLPRTCNATPRTVPIFAAGSGFESRKSEVRRNGPGSRRTLGSADRYMSVGDQAAVDGEGTVRRSKGQASTHTHGPSTILPSPVQFPRLCLSLSLSFCGVEVDAAVLARLHHVALPPLRAVSSRLRSCVPIRGFPNRCLLSNLHRGCARAMRHGGHFWTQVEIGT
jgi:hypothetical protein